MTAHSIHILLPLKSFLCVQAAIKKFLKQFRGFPEDNMQNMQVWYGSHVTVNG